jgi:hypothetical protein
VIVTVDASARSFNFAGFTGGHVPTASMAVASELATVVRRPSVVTRTESIPIASSVLDALFAVLSRRAITSMCNGTFLRADPIKIHYSAILSRPVFIANADAIFVFVGVR